MVNAALLHSENFPGKRSLLAKDYPMPLDNGQSLSHFTLAYQTYGQLNAAKDNAILVCHTITGDQFVSETHPITGKPGWWSLAVGPGQAIDTERFFVICINVIGGCMGSIGPWDTNPATRAPWGLDFPVITIADMVRGQKLLIDSLGIGQLFAVIGGSMGGMQVLEWAAHYPSRLKVAMVIASAPRMSVQNIAFHEVGRQAIMADPDWRQGRYADFGVKPMRGLAVARMGAHITYLSQSALHHKFGRNLQDRHALSFGFEADFQVESYLRHQGRSFVERFDANSYLYMTRAMDYFDLAAEHGGRLADVFSNVNQEATGQKVKFCLVSFSSDWLFPTAESRLLVRALNAVGADVSFVEITTDKGHDSFLLDEPEFLRLVRGFIDGAARAAGII
jgi:homoserine O-acetyltransferase/O-succinyltransferase